MPDAVTPQPISPALERAARRLRGAMVVSIVIASAVFLFSVVKLVPLIFQNQSAEDRFGMLAKVFVWLTGLALPAAAYWQIRKRISNADALATVGVAIGFAHTMIGCAALGAYWNQYTVVERTLIITWACAGAIVFVFGILAETSKPQEPEPPPKRHVPKPDVD